MRSWRSGRSRRDCTEAVGASRNRSNSGSTEEPASAVAGGSSDLPTSSFPDLIRRFLGLSGSVDQRGAVLGSLLSAAGVSGAGGVPAPAAQVTSAAPVPCSSAVPAPGVLTPTGAASVTASPGRCELARESSSPKQHCRRSSGRERSNSGGKRGRGRSPSPARSACLASASASSSSESSASEVRVSAAPPPPSSLPGAGGGRSGSDHSVSGRARSSQPGPSGLGSGERAALTGPARRFAVSLPPLLRVRRRMTVIVYLVRRLGPR